MALKAKVANSLKVDENGFVNAELADITLLDASESDFDKEQFLFDFIAEGALKPVNLKLWSGTTLNPEKFNDGKVTDYNKLTKICIQLGLVSENDLLEALKAGIEPDINLDTLIGLKVKFKITKSMKSKGLSQIDLNTLQPVKAAKSETSGK